MIDRFLPSASIDSHRVIRLLIIVGVILLSIAIASLASLPLSVQVLILILGVVGAWILMQYPGIGLIVLAVGGMLLPNVGPFGLNIPMMLVAAMLALWVFDIIMRQRRHRFVVSGPVRPLLAFVGVAVLAFLVGQLDWFDFTGNAPLDAQLGGLALAVLSAGAFLLVANQARDLRWLQAMTWVFLAAGSLFIIGRLLINVAPFVNRLFQGSALGGVFWAWLPALTLGQALYNRDLWPGWRWALLFVTVATLYVGFTQNFRWKSGWVPSFAGVAAVLAFRSWRVGLVMAVIGSIPLWTLLPGFFASDTYSLSTRLDAWVIMAEIIKISPVLGLGFGNYYWYTPLYRIRGWAVSFNSHNNFIDIVAQMGLVGLACFLWFFWECGRLSWRLRDRASDGFSQAYVYGAFGGLVGTLVAAMLGDWVVPFAYNVGLNGFRTGVLAWVFLGGLVAIEQFSQRDPESSQ